MATPTKKKTTTKSDESTGGSGGKGSRGPTKVQYPAKPVEEMAEPIKRQSGGHQRYMRLMEPLVESPGQLFLLAEYQAETGANRVKNQIAKGKTEVPGGPDAWELTAVRTEVPDGEGGTTIGSHLYGEYLG